MVKHLPKALMLALLLGGCGVDYQKCEAIKGSLESAQTSANNVKDIALKRTEAPYLEKDCSHADLERLAKEAGLIGKDELFNPYSTDRFQVLLRDTCQMKTVDKYRTQIREKLSEKLKDREIIEAEARVDRIVSDYKWNRCM